MPMPRAMPDGADQPATMTASAIVKTPKSAKPAQATALDQSRSRIVRATAWTARAAAAESEMEGNSALATWPSRTNRSSRVAPATAPITPTPMRRAARLPASQTVKTAGPLKEPQGLACDLDGLIGARCDHPVEHGIVESCQSPKRLGLTDHQSDAGYG